ncbi:MAG: formylglycine-generating enzyme family protein [Alphaproteobacteria bacterium]|nr:formylglycine-generating enzyme family protein [Alphaproteobacteria bacterium]
MIAAWPALALAGVTTVGPGTYRPLYPVEGVDPTVPVAAFGLDETPVTVAEYAVFVAGHPEWRRDRVSRLFADEGYLTDWATAEAPGEGLLADAPVTRVSWFAARAYCRERGARLPTESEWELAAAGRADGTMSEAELAQVLAWYGRPTPPRHPSVGGPPNGWGARDLHDLVWEWVEDFNASLVSVDNREQSGADRVAFCGAGALGAADRDDYAAFMRVAFRSSLRATTTTRNLGFRCASEVP